MKPGKGFKRQAPAGYDRDPDRVRHTPTARPGDFRQAQPVSDAPAAAVEKEGAIQSEAYMAIVRMFPCMHCGIVGFTQFAHSDSQGKGLGLKTDCRLGMPLCGPHGDEPGCHWLMGTSGRMGREKRRELEKVYGDATRAWVLELNLWPRRLPRWKDA